jgi:hypothetical protein
MPFAIDLDGQTQGLAVEIKNVRSNRVLAAELQTVDLPALQLSPKQAFRQRQLLSKALCREALR